MEHVVGTGSGFRTHVAPVVGDRAKSRARARVVALHSMILLIATFTFLRARANDDFDTADFNLVEKAAPFNRLPTETIGSRVDLRQRPALRLPTLMPLLLEYGRKIRPKAAKAEPATTGSPLPSAEGSDSSSSSRGSSPGQSNPAVAPRIKVHDRSGKTVVARVHGGTGDETHVMLPDGQLGVPEELTYTDEPFRPVGPEEVAADLLAGPLAGFELKTSAHYLVFYKSSDAFAAQSAKLLEDLYTRLLDVFRRNDVPIHESEFPLVAVIFGTEAEFRKFRQVDPLIRAYYEIYTNRIYFYETSEQEEAAPEVAALRRPQTIAHEGTHQILQNIGVQPRLAAWPAWLVEGLAEYCAAPLTTRKGTAWSVLGAVNAQHVATIRDLADPAAGQFPGAAGTVAMGRRPDQTLVEYVVTRTELTPTDYALSWAVTHYLAFKRLDEFMEYIRVMSRLRPLEPKTADEHLASFQKAFKTDLSRLDREINRYLGKLRVVNPLPYYTMIFEQRMQTGVVRRAAIVSQSPSVLRQWLETVTAPRGEPPSFHILEYETRTPAMTTAEAFVRGD